MDESVDLEVNFKVKPFARFGLPGFVEVKIQEEGLLSRYEDKPIPRHSGVLFRRTPHPTHPAYWFCPQ